MIKRILSFLFLSIAVISLSTGVFLLTVRHSLLSEDYYKRSLKEAGFYDDVSNLIKENAQNFLERSTQNEEEFGSKLMSRLVPVLIEEIDISAILQETAEENIANLTLWLKGKQPLSFYFPRNLLIANYKSKVGDEKFIQFFLESSGYFELPDCTSSVNILNFTLDEESLKCKHPILEERIKQELRSRFPAASDSLAEGFLDSMASDIDEETPLSQFNFEQNQLDQIQSIPRYLNLVLYASIGLILFSGLLTVVSAKLSLTPKRVLKRVVLYSGILLTIIGTTFLLAIPEIIKFVLRILLNNSQKANGEQVEKILNTVVNFINSLATNLMISLIWVGVFMMFLILIIVLGMKVVSKMQDSSRIPSF